MLVQISSWHDGLNTISPLYLLAQNQQNTWNMVPPDILWGKEVRFYLFSSPYFTFHILFLTMSLSFTQTRFHLALELLILSLRKVPGCLVDWGAGPDRGHVVKWSKEASGKEIILSASTTLKMSGSLPTPCFCICDSHCLQRISSPN